MKGGPEEQHLRERADNEGLLPRAGALYRSWARADQDRPGLRLTQAGLALAWLLVCCVKTVHAVHGHGSRWDVAFDGWAVGIFMFAFLANLRRWRTERRTAALDGGEYGSKRL